MINHAQSLVHILTRGIMICVRNCYGLCHVASRQTTGIVLAFRAAHQMFLVTRMVTTCMGTVVAMVALAHAVRNGAIILSGVRRWVERTVRANCDKVFFVFNFTSLLREETSSSAATCTTTTELYRRFNRTVYSMLI